MKKQSLFLLAIITGILICGTAAMEDPPSLAPAHALTIATVDMQELFKQYHRTQEAQEQINVERARIQKDNNERLARLRELATSIENLSKQVEDPAVADSRKQTLYRELQAQRQEANALDRERREFLQRRNQALNEKMVQRMRGILEEIRALVEEQARKDDYDFVFDKSGLSTSQVPVLLYAKDATDITALLLKSLNREAPADFTPTNSESDLAPIIAIPE